jgi:hypothetical protein
MDEVKFWEIVGSVHDRSNGDMDEKCSLLSTALSKLPKDEAKAFSALFDAMMDRAYSWPLWGAAYVINGGCGDDTFSDFRASLISRGRTAYESALSDPESLATEHFDEDVWFYEGYQYAVTDGVKASVGSVVNRESPHPDEPSGQAWDEDKVYDLYPKLAEKFA